MARKCIHCDGASNKLSLCLALVSSPILKPSSLASWSQVCLLNSIAVFETVRSYQLKENTARSTRCFATCIVPVASLVCITQLEILSSTGA